MNSYNESNRNYYDRLVGKSPQAQFDTTEQIRILLAAGNKLGLYDAVDRIKLALRLE